MSEARINHTQEAYSGLAEAYAYFNRTLFDNELPNCVITYQRKKGMFGYFHAGKLGHDEIVTDEIALNPSTFNRSKEETLSTLAHEMCHLWQQHFGEAPKSAYHNKQWAAKMKRIGLQPSATGAIGGKETGPKVSHYIEKNGLFNQVCADFLEANTLNLYGDQFGDKAKGGKAKAKNKTVYVCPECEAKCWAKPGLLIRCEEDNQRFIEDGKEASTSEDDELEAA